MSTTPFEYPPDFDINNWITQLDSVHVSQEDIDNLVMDYLVVEGYKETAEAFATEIGLSSSMEPSLIAERMQVRSAIINGDILKATDAINDIDVEILEKDKKLFFGLQIQHLIELVKLGKIEDALHYAQQEVAVHYFDPEYQFDSFLPTLEEVMTLLMFEDPTTSPLAPLLDNSKRLQVASDVNSSILSVFSQSTKPKLYTLLEALSSLQEKQMGRKDFPKITADSVVNFLKQSKSETEAMN
ncbi:hypothetical protein P9112_002501 [Eukaryota sp. TZLM1-RC]